MSHVNEPLDGFDNPKLKLTAYAMAMTTLFHKDESEMVSALIDARNENTESLDRHRAFGGDQSSESREEAELMDDQLRQMIEHGNQNLISMQRVIRHYGNTLGSIPLVARDAIAGDLYSVSVAEHIVQCHADELWKDAMALNEKTTAALTEKHKQKLAPSKSAEPSL